MNFKNNILLGTQNEVLNFINGIENSNIQSFSFEGINDLDMGILFSIVCQEEFKFSRHELLPLEEGCPVETVFPLPATFCERLKQLTENEQNEAAAEWAATEELNCAVEKVLPIVQNLCTLAQQAANEQSLFFQMIF